MAAGGRTPKQRRFDMSAGMALRNFATRRRRGSCKCLFGIPDRDDTKRLMAEQYTRERKRFIRRFNFDIETECDYKAAKLDSPVKFFDDDDKEESRSPVRTGAEALASVTNTDLRVLGSPRRGTSSNGSTPRTPRTPRTPHAPRTPRTPRTPASRRQLQMTEYWTTRKRTDSESSDKEN